MKKILGFAGSLRQSSYNRAILHAAAASIPVVYEYEEFDLGVLPLYNDDHATDELIPDTVRDFREKITTADGVLIASPEYNYSITGVLKNALDWAATNKIGNVLSGKPIAIMGASKTVFGTTRGQLHLRQVLQGANGHVLRKPEVYVRQAKNLVDSNGKLADEKTIAKINELVAAFLLHMERDV